MSKQEVLQKIEKLRTELFDLATDPKQAVDVRNMGYWISIGAAGAISIVEELDEPPITDEQAWNKIAEAYPDSPQSLRNTLDNAVFGKASKSQKPVVPKFVADWFEDNKHDIELGLYSATLNAECDDYEDYDEFYDWLKDGNATPYETITRMKYGYEVEQEPLYMVPLLTDKEDNKKILVERRGEYDIIWDYENECDWHELLTEEQIKSVNPEYWKLAVLYEPSEEVA